MKLMLIRILIFLALLSQTRAASASMARVSSSSTLPTKHGLQAFREAFVRGGSARCVAQMVLYPVDALRTLAQTRDGRTLADVGANALVRGCVTTSSFALAMGALQFSIFGAFKDKIGTLGASVLGAAGSCLVSVPQEVIKQRLVTGVYASFRDAVATIYQQEGVQGFYSAWRPTMARNVPFVVITFTTMDMIKQRLLREEKQELTLLENL